MFPDFNPKIHGCKFQYPILNDAAWTPKYVDTTADYQILETDFSKVLVFLGGTARAFTLPSAYSKAMDAGWCIIVVNRGTADLTISASDADLGTFYIDDIGAFYMYPGEVRFIYSNGSTAGNTAHGTFFSSIVLQGFRRSFTSTTTFLIPPNYREFDIEMIGGGGAGAARAAGNAGGGGAGGYCRFTIPASSFVAAGLTETVTIAGTAAGVTGNTNGTAGNVTSITINGTTYSTIAATVSTHNAAAAAAQGGGCGMPPLCGRIVLADAGVGLWNGKDLAASATNLNAALYGASGGGVSSANAPKAGGDSINGPGGGGGSSTTAGGIRTGGVSLLAGNGGAGGANSGADNGVNGVSPGGGGGGSVAGGTSGSGAGGRVYIIGRI